PLHAAMAERGVEATLFLDLSKLAKAGDPGDPAEAAADRFLAQNWPFGDPRPALYYAPGNAAHDARFYLHAKGVVVDESIALITSANFTSGGQSRNVELGVRI